MQLERETKQKEINAVNSLNLMLTQTSRAQYT